MYSKIRYTGDGSTKRFLVAFTMGNLRQSFVRCRVGDEVTTAGAPLYRELTWDAPDSNWVTVGGSVAPRGVRIEFSRVVPKDAMLWQFQNGAPQNRVTLDENYNQIMMGLHEIYDDAEHLIGNIIDGSTVQIESVTSLDDVGVIYDATNRIFIFRVRMGEIALSDKIDGTRPAEDLVGASEKALGEVNAKIDKIVQDGIGSILEVSNTRDGIMPAFGVTPLNSLPMAQDTKVVWKRPTVGNASLKIDDIVGGGLQFTPVRVPPETTDFTSIDANALMPFGSMAAWSTFINDRPHKLDIAPGYVFLTDRLLLFWDKSASNNYGAAFIKPWPLGVTQVPIILTGETIITYFSYQWTEGISGVCTQITRTISPEARLTGLYIPIQGNASQCSAGQRTYSYWYVAIGMI